MPFNSVINTGANLMSHRLQRENSIEAFRNFCSRLRYPVLTEHDYLIANVKLICYKNRQIRSLVGELMMIIQGRGLGNIRVFDGELSLLDEDIYNVFESQTRKYTLGRSGFVLVVEDSANSNGIHGIHRIDLIENLQSPENQ